MLPDTNSLSIIRSMMTKKLTLNLDGKIIQQAKLYAKKQNRSLSGLVEEYFRGLIQASLEKNDSISALHSPLTNSLSGIAASKKSEQELIAEYLQEKYL